MRMRSPFLVVLMFLVAMSMLFAAGGQEEASTVSEQSYTLRLGHVTSADFPYHIAAEEFARLVNEGTGGKVKIDIFPNAQLGNEQVLTDSLILGTLDFSITNQAYTSSYVPEFGFLSVSYLFTSDQHVENVVLDPKFIDLMTSYVDKKKPGFTYLSTLPSGVRSIYSTVPLRSYADVQGYKIRIMPSEIETKVWNTLGTQSLSVPFGEVYSALQTELAEGAENTPSAYFTHKHYEVAPYFVKTEHQYLTANFLASNQTLNKLPEDFVKVIKDAAVKSCKVGADYAIASDAKVLDTLSKEGVTVIDIDKKPFVDAISPLHEKLAQEMNTIELLTMIRSKAQ